MTTILLTLSIFLMLNSIPTLSFSCLLHQKEALLHFKYTLTTLLNSSSVDLVTLNSWISDSDCCTWNRVTCDTTTSVTELNLYMVIPDKFEILVPMSSDILTPLFHIRSLKRLDISHNSLVGQIPGDGFGNLTRLVHLSMNRNNLTGSIPYQLLQLSNLQVLELRLNTLEGPIPPQLFELKSLRYLDLGCNVLKGVLSSEVGKLQNLKHLILDQNLLLGNIPEEIGNLTKLKELNFGNNKFSNRIPSSILNLKELESLDLSNNQFTGQIPSSIRNLTKLQILMIQHNKLTGNIPTWFFNITTLKELFIGGEGSNLIWNYKANIVPRCSLEMISMTNCRISGQIPQWISSQKNLYSLDLSMNQLEGRFPDWLVEMYIPSILLSDNKLTGSIPSRLFKYGRLKVLGLARNNFSEELPNNIGYATQMRILVLSENNLFGKLPMSMSNMSMLQVLDLSRNKFSGDSFPDFRESIFPCYLDFSFNEFFGNIPTSFSEKTQILSLGGNRFSGNLPSNMTNLVSLKSLDLHGNDITGNFQYVLPQIQTLEVLNLRQNSIVGFIPRTISNLSSLRILDLSENNLTGSIPHEIAKLERMIQTPKTIYTPFEMPISEVYMDSDLRNNIEFDDLIVNWKNSFKSLPSHTLGLYSLLDLSDNRLSGQIPASLGNLKGLKVLNISHNNISGNIPVSFGNLTNIESLDLSHNRISGSIPQSIANLDQLTTLDVSNNRLTGKIPMGKQMNTMDEPKSYANNSGLCGMQMKVTCAQDIPPSPTDGPEDEEENNILSLVFWEGTWVGFLVRLLSTILIIGYFLNFLQLF